MVAGNILLVQGQIEDYYLVEMPDGRQGKIRTQSIVPYEDFIMVKQPLQDNIIETASSFLGQAISVGWHLREGC